MMLVYSEIKWSEGDVSGRIFDYDKPEQRKRFAQTADTAIRKGGQVLTRKATEEDLAERNKAERKRYSGVESNLTEEDARLITLTRVIVGSVANVTNPGCFVTLRKCELEILSQLIVEWVDKEFQGWGRSGTEIKRSELADDIRNVINSFAGRPTPAAVIANTILGLIVPQKKD